MCHQNSSSIVTIILIIMVVTHIILIIKLNAYVHLPRAIFQSLIIMVSMATEILLLQENDK